LSWQSHCLWLPTIQANNPGLTSLQVDPNPYNCNCQPEPTPEGSAVAVTPTDNTTGTTPVGLTFEQVAAGGDTTLLTSTSGPEPSPGFQLGDPPTYYEITTTASYAGLIDVCISYAGVSFPGPPESLRLMHYENGQWVDRTTVVDTQNQTVCGAVTSLSPFAIMLAEVQDASFYLHGVAPGLTLDNAAPTGTTAQYKDSPSVNRTAFKEIGTWTYLVPSTMSLQSLRDLRVWVGLKNSDDQGTYFDLRAELLKNGTPVASGETLNIQGVTRNADKAKEVAVAFGTISDGQFNAGDVLSLKILTKVTATGGHSNAVGLRLYYDSLSRPSAFETSLIR